MAKADIRFWCKYCCLIARKPLILLAFWVNPISPLAPGCVGQFQHPQFADGYDGRVSGHDSAHDRISVCGPSVEDHPSVAKAHGTTLQFTSGEELLEFVDDIKTGYELQTLSESFGKMAQDITIYTGKKEPWRQPRSASPRSFMWPPGYSSPCCTTVAFTVCWICARSSDAPRLQ